MVDALSNMLPNLVRYKREVYLPNRKVNLKERVPSFLGSNDLRYGTSDYVFIVNDRLFRELEGVDYQVEAVNVTVPDKESFSQRLNESLDQAWGAPLYAHYTIQHNSLVGEIGAAPISEEQALTSSKLNWSSRYPTFRAVRRQVGVFVYVAVFAGMVALISTASILMLRQFSEADSEKANYRLLKKIGISDKKIVKLIYIQNAFVFFPPMLLGVLHAFFAIHIFSQLVTNKDYWLSYLFCGLLVLVYVVFYAGTTAVYQRIIESGE